MTFDHFLNASSSKQKEATRHSNHQTIKEIEGSTRQNTQHFEKQLSEEDFEELKKSPLYQGRLSYLQETLLKEFPNITAELLAERLDISLKVAELLLADYREKKC